MSVNIPFNGTDAVVLLVLAVLFILGIRTVFGFFEKKKKTDEEEET